MTKIEPKLRAELRALGAKFAAQDAEDRRRDAARRRRGEPEPPREDVRAFEGFADGEVTPRGEVRAE